MSIITLQFGQCGNQIGQELYKLLNDDINLNRHHSHYANTAINKWFNISPKTETLEARSILIDTETKTAPTPTPYRFRNSLLKNHGGCANNWAYGHNCKSQLYEDDILNSVRNEVEKCDYLSSILNIFSSSGGTGSGLGSALTEKIRDEFPSKSMINVLVLPYSSGELVTQNYNTLLCLGNIYPNADACILFENDRLTHICNHSQNLNDVNFSDVNALIAQQLGAIFQPICNVNNFELVQNLTSNARFKFVQTRSVPEVSKVVSGFEAMSLDYKHLVQHLSKPSRYDYGVESQSKLKLKAKFIANALIARGDSLEFKKTCLKSLQNSGSYVDWLGVEERFRVYNEANGFNGMAKSLVLVSNSNSVCHRLDAVVEEAWKLFTHGAYLHHYKNFGVDEEYFLNAFQLMENILHNYKNVLADKWTLIEKRKLLLALKKHGQTNLEEIHKIIPNKSIHQIRAVCDAYRKLGDQRYKKLVETPKTPINGWIHVIKQVNLEADPEAICDILPRVLKYIALFETNGRTNELDIGSNYLVLADLMKGLNTIDVNGSAVRLLSNCLKKMARKLNEEDLSSYKKYLESLTDLDQLVSTKPEGDDSKLYMNPLDVGIDLLCAKRSDLS